MELSLLSGLFSNPLSRHVAKGISKHLRSCGRGWTDRLRADTKGLLTFPGVVFRATTNKTGFSSRRRFLYYSMRRSPPAAADVAPAPMDDRDYLSRREEYPREETAARGNFNDNPDVDVQEGAPVLQNAEGHKIVCMSWRCHANKEPRALVFLAHGFGEHCHGHTYSALACDLARVGCFVFSHDHVGHGKSEGPRAMIKSFDTYVDDILTHVDVRRTEFPEKPVYLIGHSMGGLLCVLTVQRKPKDFAGMVLLGPLLGIDKQEATWFKRTMARLMSWAFPSFLLGELALEKVSRDPTEVRRLAEDPLHYHGGVTAGWGAAALEALEKMQANVEAVRLPFLLQHGSADKLCDPADSQQFFEKAPSEDKAMKIIDGAYHSLLTEPDGVAQQVQKDIIEWISARISKKWWLPS